MKIFGSPLDIPVVHVPMESKTLAAAYVVEAGSHDERTPKEYGLFHALEHMVLGDTPKATWKETNKLFQKWGVDYNALTSEKQTVYYINTLEEFFPECFHRLSACLFETVFDEKKLVIEKKAILNEILGTAADPGETFKIAAYPNTFGKAMHDILGKSKTIEKLKLSTLEELYRKYYSTRIMTLFICGGTVKQVEDLVDSYERPGKLNTAPVRREKPLYEPFNTRPYLRAATTVPRSLHLTIRPFAAKPTFQNLAQLHVVDTMYSNLLSDVVREELGVCYHSEVGLSTVNGRYYMEMLGFTDPETDGECQAALYHIMEDSPLLSNPAVFDDYFQAARNALRMGQVEHQNNPKHELMNLIGLQSDGIFSWKSPDKRGYSSERMYEEIQKLDPKETRKICKKFQETPYKKCSLFGVGE